VANVRQPAHMIHHNAKKKWQEFDFLVLLLQPTSSEEQDDPDCFKTEICPAQILQVILVDTF
jgi:hypothetical protein